MNISNYFHHQRAPVGEWPQYATVEMLRSELESSVSVATDSHPVMLIQSPFCTRLVLETWHYNVGNDHMVIVTISDLVPDT